MAKRATNSKRNAVPIDVARFEAVAEEATVDAYGESAESLNACSMTASIATSEV